MTAMNNLTWVFLGDYKNRRLQILKFQMTVFQITTTNNDSNYQISVLQYCPADDHCYPRNLSQLCLSTPEWTDLNAPVHLSSGLVGDRQDALPLQLLLTPHLCSTRMQRTSGGDRMQARLLLQKLVSNFCPAPSSAWSRQREDSRAKKAPHWWIAEMLGCRDPKVMKINQEF